MAQRTTVTDAGDDYRSAGTRCRSCGAYLTDGFARVFGNNDDEVYACLECATLRSLRDGYGTDPGRS